MTTTKSSINVLVTRPAQQALNLSDRLAAAGFNAIGYPSIEIQALNETAVAQQALQKIDRKDYLIFVSSNAVIHANLLLNKQWPKLTSSIVAIGPKTAETLKTIGLQANIIASKPFSSESLLKQLQAKLEHQSAAIIKGEGGRPLLAAQLTKRGVSVLNIDVYKRGKPKARSFPKQTLHYITITSQLALSNLLQLAAHDGIQLKQHSCFIVYSPRIAEYARQLGCQHIHTCSEASDTSLIGSIKDVEKAKDF